MRGQAIAADTPDQMRGFAQPRLTVLDALPDLALHPVRTFVVRWNWKAAPLSGAQRAMACGLLPPGANSGGITSYASQANPRLAKPEPAAFAEALCHVHPVSALVGRSDCVICQHGADLFPRLALCAVGAIRNRERRKAKDILYPVRADLMRPTQDAVAPRNSESTKGKPMRRAGLPNTSKLFATFLFVLSASAPSAWSQSEPATAALTAGEVVQHLIEKNRERAGSLQHYVGTRTYRLEYRGFPASADATMQVEVNYDAPSTKRFTVVGATGSKLIQSKVFHRLLESEQQAGDSVNRKHTELGPDNYNFSLAGTEGNNYVLNVEPREESKFLYRGKIWIDAHDFAVTRIEAQPARNPSFWTTKSSIHHTYQKVDKGFYLPRENKTVTSVRLGGTATLTIEYGSYQLTAAKPVASARRMTSTDAAIWPDGGFNEGVARLVSVQK